MPNETNQHPDHVVGWNGSLEELAQAIGNMRYDKTAEFIELLARDVFVQSEADGQRNRPILAAQLEDVWDSLKMASGGLRIAWKICEPFMVEKGQT